MTEGYGRTPSGQVIRDSRIIPKPVVRCTLLCVYCAHQFDRDFAREDNFSPFYPGDISCPIASIEVPHVAERRTWYGRRITSVVVERQPVKCPRCGSNCGLVSREPIEVAA